ncbi:MAG: hypothetical protein KF802_02580 [Bdellovibrionaceae bacterium]|nr:hypothetical protein [Pseudobdellovibrionaceae bacterium]
MSNDLKFAIEQLKKFKGEKPRVSKTIFGEVVSADPKTVAKNSETLANLAYNFFKALSLEEQRQDKAKLNNNTKT